MTVTNRYSSCVLCKPAALIQQYALACHTTLLVGTRLHGLALGMCPWRTELAAALKVPGSRMSYDPYPDPGAGAAARVHAERAARRALLQ